MNSAEVASVLKVPRKLVASLVDTVDLGASMKMQVLRLGLLILPPDTLEVGGVYPIHPSME